MKLAFEKFSLTATQNAAQEALLVLHGLFGSKANWKSFALRTAPLVRLPIYTLDARNHGESAHTEEMSIESMCQDLKQFVEEHKFKRVSLLGHSMVQLVCILIAEMFAYYFLLVCVSALDCGQETRFSTQSIYKAGRQSGHVLRL